MPGRGINACENGRVTSMSAGVRLARSSGTTDLPVFEQGEITKTFYDASFSSFS